MTTITDRLAALPEMPEPLFKPEPRRSGEFDMAQYWEMVAAGYEPRLTLAVELLRRLASPDYAQSGDWEAPIDAWAFLQFIDKERTP